MGFSELWAELWPIMVSLGWIVMYQTIEDEDWWLQSDENEEHLRANPLSYDFENMCAEELKHVLVREFGWTFHEVSDAERQYGYLVRPGGHFDAQSRSGCRKWTSFYRTTFGSVPKDLSCFRLPSHSDHLKKFLHAFKVGSCGRTGAMSEEQIHFHALWPSVPVLLHRNKLRVNDDGRLSRKYVHKDQEFTREEDVLLHLRLIAGTRQPGVVSVDILDRLTAKHITSPSGSVGSLGSCSLGLNEPDSGDVAKHVDAKDVTETRYDEGGCTAKTIFLLTRHKGKPMGGSLEGTKRLLNEAIDRVWRKYPGTERDKWGEDDFCWHTEVIVDALKKEYGDGGFIFKKLKSVKCSAARPSSMSPTRRSNPNNLAFPQLLEENCSLFVWGVLNKKWTYEEEVGKAKKRKVKKEYSFDDDGDPKPWQHTVAVVGDKVFCKNVEEDFPSGFTKKWLWLDDDGKPDPVAGFLKRIDKVYHFDIVHKTAMDLDSDSGSGASGSDAGSDGGSDDAAHTP